MAALGFLGGVLFLLVGHPNDNYTKKILMVYK